MSTNKSYAQETADRLRKEGNFKDADVDVNDVIQIIEDDEEYIQSLNKKLAAKDAEIAMRLVRLSKENERLKAALKPVLDCELHIGDSLTEAVGEIGTSSKYGVCDEEGSDLWNEDIADSLNAVRGAQRIFKESEHEITAGLVKENELLKQEIDAKDAEIEKLKKQNAEYERQPELMAETAREALRTLQEQDAEIAELREKMGDDDLLKMARDIEKKIAEIAKLRALTTRTDNSEVIAELQRRLKVAEDALAELQTRCVASVHDGTIDPYEALKIAEDALAAIRGEGGDNAH